MTLPDTAPQWWRGASFYQLYPRSFLDSNGDGVGDLAGITARLDYVASLGVDAIWISPFFTSPMADYGYDVADYRDVDPIFGTLADFDALVEKAHGLGLKVTIDMVFAHTSDKHDWFARAAPTRAMTRPTGTSGKTPTPMAPRPTTGSPSSAARPGPGTRAASNITCISS
jgi:alpha-glucosidase